MIDPTMGWFKIFKILIYNLYGVTVSNNYYIDKSSDRVSQFFNNTWLSRYLHPHEVVFDNGYEFKKESTYLLKCFDIKPVLITIKKSQANAPVDQVHEVIINIIFTKDLDNRVFDYIYSWGETLAYIA